VLERIRAVAAKYYDYDDIYLVGNSTSNKDLSDSFSMDNGIITILTALFVMVILLFTFQSAGLRHHLQNTDHPRTGQRQPPCHNQPHITGAQNNRLTPNHDITYVHQPLRRARRINPSGAGAWN